MQGSASTLNDQNPFYSQDVGNPSYVSRYGNQSMDGNETGYELEEEYIKEPLHRPMQPSTYSLSHSPRVGYPMPPAPYGNLGTSELGPDDSASQVAWVKRQEGPKRGLTRKVKLTRGNWIVDHRVPTAVKNSIEPKWSQGKYTKTSR